MRTTTGGAPVSVVSIAFPSVDAPSAPPADTDTLAIVRTEDLKVWPEGSLPPSKVAVRKPDFQGSTGFNNLKRSLYESATSMDSATTVTFDISVQARCSQCLLVAHCGSLERNRLPTTGVSLGCMATCFICCLWYKQLACG